MNNHVIDLPSRSWKNVNVHVLFPFMAIFSVHETPRA